MANKLALVTGASSGLGVAFVRDLAARGYDIALTARSQRPMDELAGEVRSRHGVAASVYPVDLGVAGGTERLLRRLADDGLAPDVLVANAAFGLAEPFVAHEQARLTSMLQLNVVSLAELTLAVAKRMAQAGKGHILLVSSGAAYQPTPSTAAYGASKAFISSLGEALHIELAPAVQVGVVEPGPMETGFNIASGYKLSPALQRFLVSTEEVARTGLDALFAGRASVIPGRWNQLGALSTRLMSRQAAGKMFLNVAQGKV